MSMGPTYRNPSEFAAICSIFLQSVQSAVGLLLGLGGQIAKAQGPYLARGPYHLILGIVCIVCTL